MSSWEREYHLNVSIEEGKLDKLGEGIANELFPVTAYHLPGRASIHPYLLSFADDPRPEILVPFHYVGLWSVQHDCSI